MIELYDCSCTTNGYPVSHRKAITLPQVREWVNATVPTVADQFDLDLLVRHGAIEKTFDPHVIIIKYAIVPEEFDDF